MIAVTGVPAFAQDAGESGVRSGGAGAARGRGGRAGRGGGGSVSIEARIHIGKDGLITVMTGKVEGGQGARTEITQAAAEELRVSTDQITLLMADTALVPDDGGTYGSQTTPRSLPTIRQGAAAAREALIALAAQKWSVPASELIAGDGKVIHAAGKREISYAELVGDDSAKAFAQTRPSGGAVTVTAVKEWKVMGTPVMRPNRREMVTGGHHYPSDIQLPQMLYGKVLRAPSYGAKLTSIDLAPAKAMDGVIAVQDGDFVGVAAPTTHLARKALDAISKTAQWQPAPPDAVSQISSTQLYKTLKKNAQGGEPKNPFADDVAKAAKSLKQEYHVAYIQHSPMEPRTAVAQWQDGKVTVWTGTQNPFGVKTELLRAFTLSGDGARVIVPDFGGGFGGKHTGEAAIEAARLSKGAQRPVSLRWTREEEFTWAYYRPAGVILAEAAVDNAQKISNWYFLNINSGPAAVNTPYAIEKNNCRTVRSNQPLRDGSYRGLASTANNFGRESFMDELAQLSAMDPLEFRLAHLEDKRLLAVLQTVADKFDFAKKYAQKTPNIGVGISCGTDKGGYLATAAQVWVDRSTGKVTVTHVCQAFECGAIVNPHGLMSQVSGAIIQGLGGILREGMKFDKGKITNGTFTDYQVPRFADVPELDIHLIDRPDLPSSGAGESPIMGIAPAVANAVFHATGVRLRSMPIDPSELVKV